MYTKLSKSIQRNRASISIMQQATCRKCFLSRSTTSTVDANRKLKCRSIQFQFPVIWSEQVKVKLQGTNLGEMCWKPQLRKDIYIGLVMSCHIYAVNEQPGPMRLLTRGHDFMLPFVKCNFNKKNFIVRALYNYIQNVFWFVILFHNILNVLVFYFSL